MRAKYREKSQPLGQFSGLALGKELQFCTIRSKNQNKSRLSWNVMKLYRHFYKNTYRGSVKFHSIPRSLNLF